MLTTLKKYVLQSSLFSLLLTSNVFAAGKNYETIGVCVGTWDALIQINGASVFSKTSLITNEVIKSNLNRVDRLYPTFSKCEDKFNSRKRIEGEFKTFREKVLAMVMECEVKITNDDKNFMIGYYLGLQTTIADPSLKNPSIANLECLVAKN